MPVIPSPARFFRTSVSIAVLSRGLGVILFQLEQPKAPNKSSTQTTGASVFFILNLLSVCGRSKPRAKLCPHFCANLLSLVSYASSHYPPLRRILCDRSARQQPGDGKPQSAGTRDLAGSASRHAISAPGFRCALQA